MTDDLTVPDEIEVGRYALRTFDLGVTPPFRLKSLYQETYWDGGKMIAECRNQEYTNQGILVVRYPVHRPPEKGCTCGVYGTLTLDQLHREYGVRTYRIVAVIAAEGETVIGPKGLRTAAARVVAYWRSGPGDDQMWNTLLPGVTRRESMAKMLEEFGFPPYLGGTTANLTDEDIERLPKWDGSWPPDPAWQEARHKIYKELYRKANPVDFTRYQPPGVHVSGGYSYSTGSMVMRTSQIVQWGGGIVSTSSGVAYASTNSGALAVPFAPGSSSEQAYEKIKGLVKDTITAAGLNAIRHSLGLPPLDKP